MSAPIKSGRIEAKALDPADLSMAWSSKDGVRVTEIGEDGDTLIMGHHDHETTWALYAEFQRYQTGEDLTSDDSEVYDITRVHVTFSDHAEDCEKTSCDCANDRVCGACLAGSHDLCDHDHCECADGWDHDVDGFDDGAWPCDCECYCDEYAWWADWTKSGHEATLVRWSYPKSEAWRKREAAAASGAAS